MGDVYDDLDFAKIVAYNEDQIDHVILVQKQVLEFCNKITVSAIEHDRSKFSEKEYSAFVRSRESLRRSSTGTDAEYQKHLMGEGIQHHIHNNPHHAEYWDKLGLKMPVHEVISMFFDWRSRSIAKGDGMDGFWEYNLAKLKNQPHAIPIVEALKAEYYKTKMTRLYTTRNIGQEQEKLGLFETMEQAFAWSDEHRDEYVMENVDEGYPKFSVSAEWVDERTRR